MKNVSEYILQTLVNLEPYENRVKLLLEDRAANGYDLSKFQHVAGKLDAGGAYLWDCRMLLQGLKVRDFTSRDIVASMKLLNGKLGHLGYRECFKHVPWLYEARAELASFLVYKDLFEDRDRILTGQIRNQPQQIDFVLIGTINRMQVYESDSYVYLVYEDPEECLRFLEDAHGTPAMDSVILPYSHKGIVVTKERIL